MINIFRRIVDHDVENSSSVSVTSDEVARQIRAVTDPFTQQLAHLCQLMHDLRNELSSRRHKKVASFRSASTQRQPVWHGNENQERTPSSKLTLAHQLTNSPIQDYPDTTKNSVWMMKTKEQKTIPPYRCIKSSMQSTTYQISYDEIYHKRKYCTS